MARRSLTRRFVAALLLVAYRHALRARLRHRPGAAPLERTLRALAAATARRPD
jgi:hypothetical protein